MNASSFLLGCTVMYLLFILLKRHEEFVRIKRQNITAFGLPQSPADNHHNNADGPSGPLGRKNNMKKYYYVSNYSGRYFVLGAGFTAASKATASKLTNAQIEAARSAGFEPGTAKAVEQSFAVNYVRREDLGCGGSIKANTNNPSKRRFATFDEAFQHGTKLLTRESSKGHLGFYVIETSDAVNAAINWKTGLTNSL